MKKRNFVAAVLLGASALGAHAQAPAYPAKPVRLFVGFAPGGAADYVARAMSDAMGKALGQSIIIENKPGAGSSIAADMVAKAPPDGYTILIASPRGISVNPAHNPKLTYAARDFAPIIKLTSSPLVVAANPASGISSIQDLIARARKAPGALNYATSGNGSAPHLGAALFSQVAGVQMTHIPFKGGAPAVQSVVAGDTQITFGTPPSVLPMIQAGRLKGLAVTKRERTALVPGIPGMAEAGCPSTPSSSGTDCSCRPQPPRPSSRRSSRRRQRPWSRRRSRPRWRARAPKSTCPGRPKTSRRFSKRTKSSGSSS